MGFFDKINNNMIVSTVEKIHKKENIEESVSHSAKLGQSTSSLWPWLWEMAGL